MNNSSVNYSFFFISILIVLSGCNKTPGSLEKKDSAGRIPLQLVDAETLKPIKNTSIHFLTKSRISLPSEPRVSSETLKTNSNGEFSITSKVLRDFDNFEISLNLNSQEYLDLRLRVKNNLIVQEVLLAGYMTIIGNNNYDYERKSVRLERRLDPQKSDMPSERFKLMVYKKETQITRLLSNLRKQEYLNKEDHKKLWETIWQDYTNGVNIKKHKFSFFHLWEMYSFRAIRSLKANNLKALLELYEESKTVEKKHALLSTMIIMSDYFYENEMTINFTDKSQLDDHYHDFVLEYGQIRQLRSLIETLERKWKTCKKR